MNSPRRNYRPQISSVSQANSLKNTLAEIIKCVWYAVFLYVALPQIKEKILKDPVVKTAFGVKQSVDSILKNYTPSHLKNKKIEKSDFRNVASIKKLKMENKNDFDFLTFASNADMTSQQMDTLYGELFDGAIGMFPAEMVKKNLKIVYIGEIKDEIQSDAFWYTNIEKQIIKVIPAFYQIFSIQEGKSRMDPATENIIFHEMTHNVLSHGNDTTWSKQWEKAFGNSPRTKDTVIKNIDETDSDQEIAEFWWILFSRFQWINTIKPKIQKNPIFAKKVQLMKQFFYEASNGKINEAYWTHIQNGNIRNARDAQDFFNGKLKIKSQEDKMKEFTEKLRKRIQENNRMIEENAKSMGISPEELRQRIREQHKDTLREKLRKNSQNSRENSQNSRENFPKKSSQDDDFSNLF